MKVIFSIILLLSTYMDIRQLADSDFPKSKTRFPWGFVPICDTILTFLVVTMLSGRHVGQPHSLSGSSGVGSSTKPVSLSVSTRSSDAFRLGTKRSTISFAAAIASL